MKILITGIAGSGKTSICKELNRLGYCATDLDTNGTCAWINKLDGTYADYSEGLGSKWIENHRWQVIVSKLSGLLDSFPTDKDVFVTGKIARIQIMEIFNLFDIVILLTPKDLIIQERLEKRISNHKNFAKTEDERKLIVQDRYRFEDECKKYNAIVIENNGELEDVINEIFSQIGPKVSYNL